MANSSKVRSLTNVTINPNGSITKREIYPRGVFTTTYNPNRTVRTPRVSNNTTRPKKRKDKPPPPINAQEVWGVTAQEERGLTEQETRAKRKAAERNHNRRPHQRLRGGSRTRKRRYF